MARDLLLSTQGESDERRIPAPDVSEAQRLFERMLGRANALGLFAEEIDPESGAHLGNFPQAFSHIGVINAAVSLAHAGQAGTVPAAEAESAHRSGTGGGGRRAAQPVPRG
jgi:Glycosyl hydrolases family 15